MPLSSVGIMARQRAATVLVAILAIAAVLAVAALVMPARTSHPHAILGQPANSFYSGYFTPSSELGHGTVGVSQGGYVVSYAMDVRFQTSNPVVTLQCELIDSAHVINAGVRKSVQIAKIPGRLTHLHFLGVYLLPNDTTIKLRCHPSAAGAVSVAMENVRLQVIRGD
jgi:hypothetical protein